MIDKIILNSLKESKNLLAFSAGVDSTALFFLLKEKKINFDIAIVNYNIRDEAIYEVEYAKELAKKYNKKIFIKEAKEFNSNFEANAREFRYNFFKNIIKSQNYNNLLTAHHLNDKLEWFLMRLSKGAGVLTLSGMSQIEQRDNFNIIRPLLNITKDKLINYLEKNSIKYFIDKSNFDTKFERNRFRPIVNKLLENGKDGYIRSFEFLQNDANIIKSGFRLKYKEKELRVIELNSIDFAPNALNFYLKELGYLISYKEQLLIKEKKSFVIGRTWAVELVDTLLYIAPYLNIVIPKEDREKFRKAKIPPKIRGYIYSEKINCDF